MWWNAEESGRRSIVFPTPPNYTWNRPAPPCVKRETLVSTRWNPTPEQLQGLEELYRRGTRTPSAEQIQHIAARLRRFGKIEGKNVFYWFQNHKARERQKKRRQLEIHGGASAAGLSSRRYHDHKKMATPSNCTTPPQESVSMHGSVIAEGRKEVWTQPNHKELQDEITSWKLDYFTPFNGFATSPPAGDDDAIKENRTLQLFPILNNYEDDKIHDHDHVSSVCLAENKSKMINEFIEFLPTKKCV